MKRYILNFDQEFVLKIYKDNLSLTTDDLLILHHIIDMFLSNSCEHITKNDKEYVWVNRKKILEDLPILAITEHRLSTIFAKLEKLELVERKVIAIKGSGSKTYFHLTDITLSALEKPYLDKVLAKLDTLRDDKNVKSDNIYNIYSSIYTYYSNNISNISDLTKMSSQEEKKLSTPQKCLLENEKRYSDSPELLKILNEYLYVRLSIKDKPLEGIGRWKGMLNVLDKMQSDKVAIVQQSIDNRWAKFVEVQHTYNKKYTGNNAFGEIDVESKHTGEEKRSEESF